MGNICCGRNAEVVPTGPEMVPEERDPRWMSGVFNPLGPGDAAAYFAARANVFLLGDSGAGKTALWMRLVYPSLPADEALGVVAETHTLHCEAVRFGTGVCHLWDLAGDAAMARLQLAALDATMFVRGAVWVVSMTELDRTSINRQKRALFELLAKPNFRLCRVALLFNTCDLFADEDAPWVLTQQGKQVLRFLSRVFDVAALTRLFPQRFTWAVVNCKAGFADPRLTQALGVF